MLSYRHGFHAGMHADVLVYLVLLADKLGIDLIAASAEKIAINAKRYPADTVRGKATKYDKY